MKPSASSPCTFPGGFSPAFRLKFPDSLRPTHTVAPHLVFVNRFIQKFDEINESN